MVAGIATNLLLVTMLAFMPSCPALNFGTSQGQATKLADVSANTFQLRAAKASGRRALHQ
jgi:hypothetical protein